MGVGELLTVIECAEIDHDAKDSASLQRLVRKLWRKLLTAIKRDEIHYDAKVLNRLQNLARSLWCKSPDQIAQFDIVWNSTVSIGRRYSYLPDRMNRKHWVL